MRVEIELKNYRCFTDDKPATFIVGEGFTSFVGVNNSGKSSLLKFFYEFRNLFARASHSDSLLNALRGQDVPFNPPKEVLDANELFNNSNTRPLQIAIKFIDVEYGTLNNRPTPNRVTFLLKNGAFSFTATLHSEASHNSQVNMARDGVGLDEEAFNLHGVPMLYMAPVFRAFRSLTNTLYIGPFRNALNFGISSYTTMDYYDIQVGQAFITQWRNSKTGNSIRENEATLKLTEDIRHIFGFDKLEINPSANDQTLKLMINDRSRTLHEVGAGFAQFVLVLANAAIKNPAYILIDEPELNLHPSLQLDFLTTLGSYAPEGVLFATHSLGLARSSAENIYAVRVVENSRREVWLYDKLPRLAEFAGQLSFAGQNDLGFDKILLIEGVTETKTIQQFLRKLGKDHQVLLLPMGGASLINGQPQTETQLEELKRITSNIYALIDSERTTAGAPLEQARQDFQQLCTRVGITCHVLDDRATENYLNDRAVKQALGPGYSALAPFQARNNAHQTWAKSMNWIIAREMTLGEIESTDLGQFLKQL